jgi:hypothetical protein
MQWAESGRAAECLGGTHPRPPPFQGGEETAQPAYLILLLSARDRLAIQHHDLRRSANLLIIEGGSAAAA